MTIFIFYEALEMAVFFCSILIQLLIISIKKFDGNYISF